MAAQALASATAELLAGIESRHQGDLGDLCGGARHLGTVDQSAARLGRRLQDEVERLPVLGAVCERHVAMRLDRFMAWDRALVKAAGDMGLEAQGPQA